QEFTITCNRIPLIRFSRLNPKQDMKLLNDAVFFGNTRCPVIHPRYRLTLGLDTLENLLCFFVVIRIYEASLSRSQIHFMLDFKKQFQVGQGLLLKGSDEGKL